MWDTVLDRTHHQIVEYEAWLSALVPSVRAQQEGEVEELLDAAACGLLEESADEKTPIKPVMSEPEVFELRRTALIKKLRFYHGEPEHDTEMLVELHRQIKTGRASQNEAIKFAGDQYDNWYDTRSQ